MRWVGVDEAGKGDYFGYLVVAAVLVDEEKAAKLKKLGVKDSKSVSDASIRKLAVSVRKLCVHDVVRISPEKYNSLYKNFGSLNKLLAWGHAQVVENISRKGEFEQAIFDKFGDEKYIKDALKEKEKRGKLKQIKIVQKIRAESDPAVAAASILARDEFLRTLRMLSREVGHVLPKGATHVEETAKELVQKYDESVLNFVAKRHFKTTARVLGK